MIEITDKIALDETEIAVTFIRASDPGGQNKVSSAAQLRFDVRHSLSLPDAVRPRLECIAGARMTKDGEIVITAGNNVLRYLLAKMLYGPSDVRFEETKILASTDALIGIALGFGTAGPEERPEDQKPADAVLQTSTTNSEFSRQVTKAL